MILIQAAGVNRALASWCLKGLKTPGQNSGASDGFVARRTLRDAAMNECVAVSF